MFDVLPTTAPIPTSDPDQDLSLAEGAATYLTRKGLDREAIVRCLVYEFDLERATAETLVGVAP